MNAKTKQRRRIGRSSVGTGTTSLLVIFTVLCFATLALLSLSTANANRSIQQRSFAGTAALAAAEGEAAAKLAELDAALADVGNEAEAAQVAESLGWVLQNGNYQCVLPMGQDHALLTEVALLEKDGQVGYNLLRQTSSFTGEWVPAAGGDVWAGPTVA